jgi:hypothetical protein
MLPVIVLGMLICHDMIVDMGMARVMRMPRGINRMPVM